MWRQWDYFDNICQLSQAFLKYTPSFQVSQSSLFLTVLINSVYWFVSCKKSILLTMILLYMEDPAFSLVSLSSTLSLLQVICLSLYSFLQHKIYLFVSRLLQHRHFPESVIAVHRFPHTSSLPPFGFNSTLTSLEEWASLPRYIVHSSPRTSVSLCRVTPFQHLLITLCNPHQCLSARTILPPEGTAW